MRWSRKGHSDEEGKKVKGPSIERTLNIKVTYNAGRNWN